MAKDINVPTNLQEPFNRLMDLIPVPFKYEQDVQKNILKYLKSDGEEFVRDSIGRAQKFFTEEFSRKKGEK
jgi:hypothetical protein